VRHRPQRVVTLWFPRAVAVVLAATALLVGAATVAQAHNILVTTSPAEGSMPAVVPAQVTLTFNQPALALGTIVVITGPAGQVQTGAAVLVINNVTEHLQPGSPAGQYTVDWRVTSADGHPVSGKFSFTARSPSPGHKATTTTSTAVGTVTSPPTGGQTFTQWWLIAVGVVALLLLGVLIVRGKPRMTPPDQRDPEE
jgi:copper resistance protein C